MRVTVVIPAREAPINSMTQIIEYIEHGRLQLVMSPSYDSFVRTAAETIGEIARFQQALADNPPLIIDDYDAGFQLVDTSRTALVIRSEISTVYHTQSLCNVKLVPLDYFDTQFICFAMQKSVNTTLLARINRAIDQNWAALDKIAARYLRRRARHSCVVPTDTDELPGRAPEKHQKVVVDLSAVNMFDLSGPLVVMAGMLAASVVIFVIERALHRDAAIPVVHVDAAM